MFCFVFVVVDLVFASGKKLINWTFVLKGKRMKKVKIIDILCYAYQYNIQKKKIRKKKKTTTTTEVILKGKKANKDNVLCRFKHT